VARFRALRLLHPKWLPLHLFTIAACVAMVLLGRWQWRVAHQHHGDIRYFAYAFQWWAFTAFAILMWCRIVFDYLRRPAEQAAEPTVRRPDDQRPDEERAEQSGYLAYRPPSVPEPDTDPERARFNAYLAELNARDAHKPSNAGG
jgi:hypothetical protein